MDEMSKDEFLGVRRRFLASAGLGGLLSVLPRLASAGESSLTSGPWNIACRQPQGWNFVRRGDASWAGVCEDVPESRLIVHAGPISCRSDWAAAVYEQLDAAGLSFRPVGDIVGGRLRAMHTTSGLLVGAAPGNEKLQARALGLFTPFETGWLVILVAPESTQTALQGMLGEMASTVRVQPPVIDAASMRRLAGRFSFDPEQGCRNPSALPTHTIEFDGQGSYEWHRGLQRTTAPQWTQGGRYTVVGDRLVLRGFRDGIRSYRLEGRESRGLRVDGRLWIKV